MMNRHDAYYEPEDDYQSDEFDYEVSQLMKPGADYDPNNVARVVEALSECDQETAKALQDCIDSKDYELIGRKIMMIAYDYMEGFAISSVEHEFNN